MTELADAVQRVAESARSLVQLEVQLAIAEIKRKLAILGIGLGLAAGAIYLLSLAVLFGLGAATAGLTYVMPVWGALLVMGGFLLLIATGLGMMGVVLIRRGSNVVPEEAIAEAQLLREDLEDVGIT
jgi:hypothetical protein